MIRMTLIALACTFAIPAYSGGPVLVTEEAAPPAVQRPDSDIGGIVVPLVLTGVVIAIAIAASQGDGCPNDEPVTPTEPVRERC